MLLAFNNGNNGTANVLCLIAAILFGLAAVMRLFAPAGPEPAGSPRYWGWTPALVDAGLCLVAIALLVS